MRRILFGYDAREVEMTFRQHPPRLCAPVLAQFVMALGMVAAPAAATVVQVPPLDALTAKSGVIVHGVVVGQRTVTERGVTFTRSVIDVKEGIKGAAAHDRLEISQLGTRSGAQVTWVAGAKVFAIGDEVVFFGNRWPKGGQNVVIPYGVGFGVFDVRRDKNGVHVIEDVGDVVELRGGQPARPAVRTYPDLTSFLLTVRGYAEAASPSGSDWTPHAG